MLITQLKKYHSLGNWELALWLLLICFIKTAPLNGVREIYGLFLWGYPLKISGGTLHDFDPAVKTFMEELIKSLEENQMDRCVETITEFLFQEYSFLERDLHKLGFRPGDLRAAPSIRYSMTEP